MKADKLTRIYIYPLREKVRDLPQSYDTQRGPRPNDNIAKCDV